MKNFKKVIVCGSFILATFCLLLGILITVVPKVAIIIVGITSGFTFATFSIVLALWITDNLNDPNL
jgi:hypothetical protein